MGFYQGFLALRNEGVTILYYYAEQGFGTLQEEFFPTDEYVWQLAINVAQPPDEQVRTFIHECLHLSPEFRRFMGTSTLAVVEPEIDTQTEQVFRTQATLVERVRNTIVREGMCEYLRLESERVRVQGLGPWHIPKMYLYLWKRRN